MTNPSSEGWARPIRQASTSRRLRLLNEAIEKLGFNLSNTIKTISGGDRRTMLTLKPGDRSDGLGSLGRLPVAV
jgi:hypothetical protein